MVKFVIVKVNKMTKAGMKLWKNKPIIPITFSTLSIPECSNIGVPNSLVNSKQKLSSYVFRTCGSGRYDVRIYQWSKRSKKTGKSIRTKKTFVRMTLVDDGDFGNFTMMEFDTHGKNNKFSKRFGIWKKIVGWNE